MTSTFTGFRLHAPERGGQAPALRKETLSLEDLSAGDTVIKVAFAGVNYKDALAAAGQGKIIRCYPRIGGIDLSGRVVSSAAPGLAPGDEVVVHGYGLGVDHDGGYAQYARVRGEWVMPLPAGISLIDAATLGTAGYTAGLALHCMEHNGLEPAKGPVAVSGATGGAGGIAIDILSRRGYEVTAVSGKADDCRDYLASLGAKDVIAPPDFGAAAPLAHARWAGCVDAVGGPMLAWMLGATQSEGVVAAFGNAGGNELSTTVFPFILRGVKLLGINANSPMDVRREVWAKLATVYRPARLQAIRRTIALDGLPDAVASMLARRSHGRIVIDMSL
ncbi:MAG: acryloyl-CoA reductase [Alcaligenaceae bacterium]|nr:acryloyl-CoA reductase [Alcaligenaceae bacterium]